jgi:hypothetical protein
MQGGWHYEVPAMSWLKKNEQLFLNVFAKNIIAWFQSHFRSIPQPLYNKRNGFAPSTLLYFSLGARGL